MVFLNYSGSSLERTRHPQDTKELSVTGAGRLRKCKKTDFAVPDPDREIGGGGGGGGEHPDL